jgi:hypothetical protein
MTSINLKSLGAIVLCVIVTACASPVEHHTMSGKVETTIPNTTIDQVAPRLINRMVDIGYVVKHTSAYQLVFEKPVENVMAAAMFGSRYDAQPVARLSYILTKRNDGTRIVMDAQVVTNPGSAYERTTDLNHNAETKKFQAMLNDLRQEFAAESATTGSGE